MSVRENDSHERGVKWNVSGIVSDLWSPTSTTLFCSNVVEKLSRKIFCYNKLVWSGCFPDLFFLFIIVILKNIFSYLIFLSLPFEFWWFLWPCILCLFSADDWSSGCCRLCHHTCPALPLFPHPTDSRWACVAPSQQTPSFSARQKLSDPAEFRIQRNSSLLQEAAPACCCWAQGRGNCAIHSLRKKCCFPPYQFLAALTDFRSQWEL